LQANESLSTNSPKRQTTTFLFLLNDNSTPSNLTVMFPSGHYRSAPMTIARTIFYNQIWPAVRLMFLSMVSIVWNGQLLSSYCPIGWRKCSGCLDRIRIRDWFHAEKADWPLMLNVVSEENWVL